MPYLGRYLTYRALHDVIVTEWDAMSDREKSSLYHLRPALYETVRRIAALRTFDAEIDQRKPLSWRFQRRLRREIRDWSDRITR